MMFFATTILEGFAVSVACAVVAVIVVDAMLVGSDSGDADRDRSDR